MARADAETLASLNHSSERFLMMVERKFGINIDYSEESLVVSDDLLSLFFKLRRNHYFIAAGVIGSYLGNVIIENIGGRWGKDFSVEKIGKIKGTANPLLRARRRLANGKQDSLDYYYRSLKLSMSQDTSFAEDKEKISAFYSKMREGGWDRNAFDRLMDISEKKYVREESADILGRIGCSSIAPELIEALKSPKRAYFAAIALQGIPDERAFAPLMRIVRKTRSPFLKMQAALALGAIGKLEAVNDLISLLEDSNEIVAHYASMALAKMKCDYVVDKILESKAFLDPERSSYAIFVLEEIGSKRAVPALVEALFSKNENVKEAAIRAFQTITDERAFKPLTFVMSDKSYKIRTLAAYALAHFQDARVVPYIKAMLQDPVQSVRLHGAKLMYWLERGQTPPRCI